MERTNARTITAATLPEPVSLITFDVSFISLRLVLGPAALTLAPGPSDMVALVKPQFEAGRDAVVRGVVRDRAVHRRVLRDVAAAARELGIGTRKVIASPIHGPEGNREFLAHMGPGPSCAELDEVIDRAVDAAWAGAEG
jgi:23S rRNA (cytidine1920-2'-O)/16S rRNA (cytidine1409-2'-O)-methyltransferase